MILWDRQEWAKRQNIPPEQKANGPHGSPPQNTNLRGLILSLQQQYKSLFKGIHAYSSKTPCRLFLEKSEW